ncbi:hypothetical protein RZE82_08285 [Mollicutes bacterium LVI A0039]|nr:hypothetical protein RZE82_08285 [Mollicutes bacterium LVI A0039]
MRLYICQTLDGFIAREDGSIDFLSEIEADVINSANDKIVNTYTNFMGDIENVVEGYATYKQIFDMGYQDQYANYNHYVITNSHKDVVDPSVTAFIDFDQLQALDLDSSKTFLVGGSKIIREAFSRKLITEVIITQLPILLGSGIKLFDRIDGAPHLEILDIFNDNRIYQVTYAVKY